MNTTESTTEVTPLSDLDLLGAASHMEGWREAIRAELNCVLADLRDNPLNPTRRLLRRNWLQATDKSLTRAISDLQGVKKHRYAQTEQEFLS